MTDPTLLNALRELPTAALADADKRLRACDPGLRPVNAGVKLVGVARTVRCHEDFLAVIRALDVAQPGDVLVVDTCGSRRAVVGELFTMESQRRGLAGLIVDGPVRDVSMLRQLALPVYARGLCPVSGTIRDLGQLHIPVQCGGVTVAPGDIVVADDDGILVGTAAEFAPLIEKARETERREALIAARMQSGTSLLSMLNLAEHVAALERGEPGRLAFNVGD